MRRYAPVFVLLGLSPLIAELLFGSTTIRNLGALIPITALYGGGAILIRELARRRGPGWGRIMLMGVAYGIVEEGLVIQTIFNPVLFNVGLMGGRVFGVNWVWSQWTIGYHALWSVTLPILLAELLFPARRSEPWLGTVGMVIVGALFAAGALALGAAFRFVIAPDYHAPPVLFISAALVAIILVALALGLPEPPARPKPPEADVDAPSPWLVGASMLVAAVAWFALVNLPQVLRDGPLVLLPMLADLALAGGLAVLLLRWSAAGSWGDLHRLAVIFGALLVSVLFGFFFITAGNTIDRIGQGAIGGVTLALLGLFAWRRSHPAAT